MIIRTVAIVCAATLFAYLSLLDIERSDAAQNGNAVRPAATRDDWRSALTAEELADLPADIAKQKRHIEAELRQSAKNGEKYLSAFPMSNKKAIDRLSEYIARQADFIKSGKQKAAGLPTKSTARLMFMRWVSEREARLAIDPEVLTSTISADIASAKQAAPRNRRQGEPTTIAQDSSQDEHEACTNSASAPPFQARYNQKGVSVGMTEAQAIQGACRANGNEVKVLSHWPGATHNTRAYIQRDGYTLAQYASAGRALSKSYVGGLTLCLKCGPDSKVLGGTSPSRDELEISLLPSGKVYRVKSRATFGGLNPRELRGLLEPMVAFYGSPSFRFNNWNMVQIGWRYPDHAAPAALELWYGGRGMGLQFRRDGLIWINTRRGAVLNDPVLRKENPQTTYCMNANDFTTLAMKKQFEVGPFTDFKLYVEGKSYEQMDFEARNYVAPGFTKKCGLLVFANFDLTEADSRSNAAISDGQTFKDLPDTMKVAAFSMVLMDASTFEEWKTTERQEVEDYIRSSK